jgi:hypothetical protein
LALGNEAPTERAASYKLDFSVNNSYHVSCKANLYPTVASPQNKTFGNKN